MDRESGVLLGRDLNRAASAELRVEAGGDPSDAATADSIAAPARRWSSRIGRGSTAEVDRESGVPLGRDLNRVAGVELRAAAGHEAGAAGRGSDATEGVELCSAGDSSVSSVSGTQTCGDMSHSASAEARVVVGRAAGAAGRGTDTVTGGEMHSAAGGVVSSVSGDQACGEMRRAANAEARVAVGGELSAAGSDSSGAAAVDYAKLRHHGDVETRVGMVDFAVNVQGSGPPEWLRERLAGRVGELGRYPDAGEERAAREAVAARHGRRAEEVLLLAGAAEGFAMLPRLGSRLAAVIHPSFTEPELALREAGVPVARVVLEPPYTLDSVVPEGSTLGAGDLPEAYTLGATAAYTLDATAARTRASGVANTRDAAGAREAYLLDSPVVPEAADLVVVGNPTNPTSVLHPVESLLGLRRAGRIVVVDEAFADAVPGEPESLAGVGYPDVLVLRSLTKTWALAGLRCGYFLGDPEVLARLNHGRPHWPLGTLQLEAIAATSTPAAVAESQRKAERIAADRDAMIPRLRALGIEVHEPARGPFLLIRVPDAELLRKKLADKGIAVRRGDTFPGLEIGYLRLAVRPAAEVDRLVAAIVEVGL